MQIDVYIIPDSQNPDYCMHTSIQNTLFFLFFFSRFGIVFLLFIIILSNIYAWTFVRCFVKSTTVVFIFINKVMSLALGNREHEFDIPPSSCFFSISNEITKMSHVS